MVLFHHVHSADQNHHPAASHTKTFLSAHFPAQSETKRTLLMKKILIYQVSLLLSHQSGFVWSVVFYNIVCLWWEQNFHFIPSLSYMLAGCLALSRCSFCPWHPLFLFRFLLIAFALGLPAVVPQNAAGSWLYLSNTLAVRGLVRRCGGRRQPSCSWLGRRWLLLSAPHLSLIMVSSSPANCSDSSSEGSLFIKTSFAYSCKVINYGCWNQTCL